jgi:hypothetical protein
MVKQLYTSLKYFHDFSRPLLAMTDKVKNKNTELEGICLSMDNLKKWLEENPDAPRELPKMTEKENS